MKTYFVRILIPVAVVVALAATPQLSSVTQAAGPVAYLSYESSAWRSGTSCCKWLYDPWNNNVFRIPMEGSSEYLNAWVSTTISNEGQKSFGAWLEHNPSVQEKQRVEFEISNSNYYTQHLEESRYYGVAMYIHPQSPDTMGRQTIFMQAWQSHDTSSSKHPPFFLRLEGNTDYRWTVNVSRDSATDTRFTPGTPETIYTSPTGLSKGVWHEFIVWFKPSVQSKGAVRVWHNGNLAVSQTSQRNFGYAPRSSAPVMNNHFAVRYGAYRTSVPEVPGDIILMFDQGKYGTSYETVDP